MYDYLLALNCTDHIYGESGGHGGVILSSYNNTQKLEIIANPNSLKI